MSILSRIFARFRSGHPDHHAIAKGMAWVILFVVLGTIARAAREMVIAYRYGIGAEVDAYLFVFNLVSWPVAVWFSVLTVVLVPLAARIRRDALAELSSFRSELLGFALLLGLTLALLGWLGLPLLLRSTWVALPTVTAIYAISMVPVLTFLAPLGVLIGLFSVWMLTAGRHTNTLLEGVPPLIVVVALLAIPGGGVEPLVLGTLIGFIIHLATLAFPLARRREIEIPGLSRKSPHWNTFWQGFGIMLAGQALMSFVGIVDQFFAARLGTGAIATLSYANRIVGLFLGLGAMAVSRATLPVFSQAQARGVRHLRNLAIYWARLLFLLGTVSMIVSWWLAPWIVNLLFERGAFTARDTQDVTEVLRYGLIQLPFYFSALVFVSYLSSRSRYVWLFWSGVIGLCSKLLGNVLLIPIYGVAGIAFATSFTYVANFVFFCLAFRKASYTD